MTDAIDHRFESGSLERNGFARLREPDLVDVARWRALAVESCGRSGSGFHTDLERAEAADRAANEVALAPLWAEVTPRVLPEHRTFMSSFLVKWPGPGSDLYVHQDSTYVDEPRYRSCVIWVALDDADDEIGNGPLRVLPGSHLLADEYRGTGTEPWFSSCTDEVFDALIPVPVQAGDLVIMDNRLIHASGPNTTDEPRIAVAGATIPVEADLIHAVAVGDGQVGVMRVDDDFYGRNSPQGLIANPPDGPFFAVAPQRRRDPDPAALAATVGRDLPVHDPRAGVDASETSSQPPSAEGTGRLLASLLGWNHRRIQAVTAGRPGPVHGAEVLPWLADLESAWSIVRTEWDQFSSAGLQPLPMELVSGSEFGVTGAWDAVILCHNGGWVPRNADRFPRTAEFLKGLPGLRAALFSSLGAGAHIPPHRGANNGVLRAHLGVVIPGDLGQCRLDVGEARLCWEEGRAFAFDDSYVHSATNETDEDRIVLMIEVDNPLPGWMGRLNRLVQATFSVHPQVRGATRRIEEVDAAANHAVITD